MIAATAPAPTSVFHSWAENASRCALARAHEAAADCGTIWRGGSIGYLGTRHPMEGADPAAYARYSDEVDTSLAFESMKRWYVGGIPIGPDGQPKGK
jgi:hypothetical protein